MPGLPCGRLSRNRHLHQLRGCGGLIRHDPPARYCCEGGDAQVEEEINALAEAKKEIYQEAKSNEFDVKIIREMIRLRKQDPKERDELETLLEEYWQAIKQAAPKEKAAA